MNERSKLQWLSVAVVVAVAALVSLRCVHHASETADEAKAPERAAGTERAAPLAPAALETDAGFDAKELEEGAEPQPPEDEDEGDASLNPIARYLRNSDVRDRDLLATLERETKKSPPPEVMELLSMRRAGATPEELARFIDSELPKDLRVRLAAKRWLRELTGAPALPASPAPGNGGGARRMAPIAPR
jgi:hypothetical protein